MEIKDFKQYQTEQSLRSYGFTDESLSAVKSAQIVSNGETQQVLHGQDVARITNEEAPASAAVESALSSQLAYQERQFSRFKHFADERITKLEIQLSDALSQLKEMTLVVGTLQSNRIARESAARPKPESKAKSTQPIDRNGIAPADIELNEYFYCGTR